MNPRLRLFCEDDSGTTALANDNLVAVRLSDILEPLLDAALGNRTFLRDFADDVLQIPTDLHDVLAAYRVASTGW